MLYRRSELEKAGGIRALAAEPAEDAATTKLVRAAGLRVRLVDAPFEQPLGYRSSRRGVAPSIAVGAAAARFVQGLLRVGNLAGGAAPLAAACYVLAALQLPSAGIIAFAAVWYGAEAMLAYAAGWHLTCAVAAGVDRARPPVACALGRRLARHRLCLARKLYAAGGTRLGPALSART